MVNEIFLSVHFSQMCGYPSGGIGYPETEQRAST